MGHGKSWTKDDVDYLEAHFGKCHVSKIASYLDRTEVAVIGKARRLGLNMLTAGGYVTLNELSKYIGVNDKTVKTWLEKGLKYRYNAILSKKYYFIDVEEFWKWAGSHRDLIDFSKMERGVLIPEPKWLDQAYKESHKVALKRNRVPWTNLEDQYLLANYKKIPTEGIALALERTTRAIEARYRKLVNKGVAKRKRNLIYWSDEEIQILIQMDKNGAEDVEIAEELGRETCDIRYKRRHLRKKGEYPLGERKKKRKRIA